MRRRHGIPDSDHRPFTVAYAAAKKSRLEYDEERSRSRTSSVGPQGSANVANQLPPSLGQGNVRHRLGFAGMSTLLAWTSRSLTNVL